MIRSVRRAPIYLAASEMPITRLLQNVKRKIGIQVLYFREEWFVQQFTFRRKNVASFSDLSFLSVAMHSWLHEHKQMWNHILRGATLRKWNKFNTQSENTILCHSLKERIICFPRQSPSSIKRSRIHLWAVHYFLCSEPSFINLRKLDIFTALRCLIFIYFRTGDL